MAINNTIKSGLTLSQVGTTPQQANPGVAGIIKPFQPISGAGQTTTGANPDKTNLILAGFREPAQTPYSSPIYGTSTSSGYVSPSSLTQSFGSGSGVSSQGGQTGFVTPPSTFSATGTPSLNTNPYQATAPSFSGLIGGLAGTAAQPSQQYSDAQKQYLTANEGLANLRTDAATQAANINGSRTNLAEAGGEQGLLQNLVAGKEAALTGEMGAAQAAAQVATGQQATQQSGLAGAAGLSAPQPYGITNVPFNPATGQFGGVAGAQAQGGIGGAGQVTGNLGASQSFYQNLVPAFNQAKSVYQGLTGFMQQNPDINPTNSNFVNNMNAWAKGQQLSDPKYNQFTQYLSELLQTLTPIIGSQGVSDYKSQLVQTMVNPTSSTSSIQAQIQNLLGIAQGKMDATYQSFSNSNSFAPGGSSSQGTTFGSFF